MAEIHKPNDMLVSTLINGKVDVMDLLQNGINAENTQLLDPQSYKDSKLIKERFSDENGNFLEDSFNNAYMAAAKLYQELAEMNTYKKLEQYVEYNAKDIFAPLDSKKKSTDFEVETVKNPLRRSHGVDSLFEWGKQTKSQRELAQMSKIWDSEKGVYLDKTAEDRGLLESIFGQSLVYATYDEDTEEIDPITGRKIKHKKGEWKLNDKGQYYTETIGNRSSYGKQFVAVSDTLTKEDSFLNKIDFFDSDGLEKSTAGIIAKTAVSIIPFLIPQTKLIAGGVSAAVAMAKALPAFAKMAEGIAVGGDKDNETNFTKRMNLIENYFSKFSKSYSDKGQQSNWGAEAMLDQVSDIFAQLYEMRAAASLSLLFKKDPTNKVIQKFKKDFFPKYIQTAITPNSGIDLTNPKIREDIIKAAVNKMPEVKKALEAQSKLSSALSLGYMALSSTSDVYKDALEGGYDRRMAGAAGIAAAVGQFAIMNAENKLNLGKWFLDESVGYSEGANRKKILDALRPEYEKIDKAVKAIEQVGDKTEKAGIFNKMIGKTVKTLKNAKLQSKGVNEYLKHGMTEALEEVTEEAIMDATKGAFDFLSYMGVGSNPNASFNTLEDFRSGSFLERYLQNAVGGFMGGTLFEFSQNKVEPWMERVFQGKERREVQTSLIHEIANGHTKDILKGIDELAELDSDIAAAPISINGKNIEVSANGNLTRGQVIGQALKNWVKTVDGVLNREGLNLTDLQKLLYAIRDVQAISILELTGLDKLVISDMLKLSNDIVEIRAAIENKTKEDDKKDKKDDKDKEEEKQSAERVENQLKFWNDYRNDYNNQSVEFLKALLKKKQDEVNDFLSGKKSEYYVKKTLVGATPEIRTALGQMSVYDYTLMKYGIDYKDLKNKDGILTQDIINKEFKEWLELSNDGEKFIRFGVEGYNRFEEMFGKAIKEYAESGYTDVRNITAENLLSGSNWGTEDFKGNGSKRIDAFIDDNAAYAWFKQLANSLKEKKDGKKTGDITLEPILQQDPELITPQVEKIINNNPQAVKILELFGINKDNITKDLSSFLVNQLSKINIDSISEQPLANIIFNFIKLYILHSLENTDLKSVDDVREKLLQNDALSVDADPKLFDSENKNDFTNLILQNLSLLLDDSALGLGTSMLQKYITSQNVIDGEVKKLIAENTLRSIITDISNNFSKYLNDNFTSKILVNSFDGPEKIVVTQNAIKNLIDLFKLKFDTPDLSYKDILNEWSELVQLSILKTLGDIDDYDSSDSSILTIEQIKNGGIAKELSKITEDFLNNNSLFKLYKEVNSKFKKENIKINPLIEMTEKVNSVFTNGGQSKLLEILKNNNHTLRNAETLEDYLPEGEAELQLIGAKLATSMLKALLIGSLDKEVEFGSPFSVNKLMKDFISKNKLASQTEYNLINEEAFRSMFRDVMILEGQVSALYNLSKRSYNSKLNQDPLIRKQYSEAFIKAIDDHVEALTFKNGISIYPPKDKIIEIKEPEQLALYYRHYIFKTFNSSFKTVEDKINAINELLDNFNLNYDDVTRASKPLNLNKDIKIFNTQDLISELAAMLSGDIYEFYYRYNDLILKQNNEIVPLFSQELTSFHAWSFAKDNNNVIHSTILNFLKNKKGENLNQISCNNIYFINGITGAGKTTTVGNIVTKLLSDKLLYITAPNTSQVKNYVNSIKKLANEDLKKSMRYGVTEDFLSLFFTGEKKKIILDEIYDMLHSRSLDDHFSKTRSNPLFKRLDLKKGTRDESTFAVLSEQSLESLLKKDIDESILPEILLIDEATLISLPLLQIINFLASKYNIKVIASGDSIQKGSALGTDTQAFNDLFLYKSPKLNITVRADNMLVGKNNQIYSQHLDVYDQFNAESPRDSNNNFKRYLQEQNILISYYQDDSTFNGYKFVENLNDKSFLEDIALIGKLNREINTDPKTLNKKPILVITQLEKGTRNPTDSKIKTILESNGISDKEYEFYSPESLHDYAVQGSEARYVIIDQNALTNEIARNNSGELLRSIYTFCSRASIGTLMVLPESIQLTLNISNQRDKITLEDTLPQLKDRDKLKENRIKSIETYLGTYKPSTETLDVLTTEKRGDKDVYVRKGYKKTSKTTSKKISTSSASELESNTGDPELTNFNEDEIALIEDAENVDYIEQGEIDESGLNLASSSRKTPVTIIDGKSSSEHTSTRISASINHLGLKRLDTNNGYERDDNFTHLDLNGLFDEKRKLVSDNTVKGFNDFKNVLISALLLGNEDDAREAMYQGILNSPHIALFLAECYSKLAQSKGINIDTQWRTSVEFRKLYADWFNEEIEIDPKYYIFAKNKEWEKDKPTTINGSKEKFENDKNPILYFGIRLWHKKLNTDLETPIDDQCDGLFNQYITLGAVSAETFINKEGKLQYIDSKPLRDLYSLARKDVEKFDFVAYELQNSDIYKLPMTSTMWIRNIKKNVDDVIFEDLNSIEKRGFKVNKDIIGLISDQRTTIRTNEGEDITTFSVIAAMALYGETSADLLKYFGVDKKLSLKERIHRLEQAFVNLETLELRIKGHYIALSGFVDSLVNDSVAFKRILILDPKKSQGKEVLSKLEFTAIKKGEKNLNWGEKLLLSRGSSLKDLMTSILSQVGAFNNTLLLEKYLIGTRQWFHENSDSTAYPTDKTNLNTLIAWVHEQNQNRIPISIVDFELKFKSLNFRRILYPFYNAFIRKSNNNYIIRNLNSEEIIEYNDIANSKLKDLQFSASTPRQSLVIESKNDAGETVQLLPESYACPYLIKSDTKLNLISAFDINVSDDITINESDFDFIQVAGELKDLGSLLGMYNYLLQAPTFLLPDIWLEDGTYTSHFEKLKQVQPISGEEDPRYDSTRKGYLDVDFKSDFDYLAYAPTTLSNDNYVVVDIKDSFTTQHVFGKSEEEEYTVKYTDKNGKKVELKRKRKIFKPANKYGQWDSEHKKFREIHINAGNGFLVRPGDYVQIYGNTKATYYVDRINLEDPDNPQLILTLKSDFEFSKDTLFNFLPINVSDPKIGKAVPAYSISAVVGRTVADKEHIKNDYYKDANNFIVEGPNKKYPVIKTVEEFNELLKRAETEAIKDLIFSRVNKDGEIITYGYMIKSFTKSDLSEFAEEGEVINESTLYDPQGHLYVAFNKDQLLKHITELNEASNVAGYVIFLNFADAIKNDNLILLKMLDSIFSSNTGELSKYIKHIIFKDPVIAEGRKKEIRSTGTRAVNYDPIEIATKLDPSKLLVLDENGRINYEASSIEPEAVVVLSSDEFNIAKITKGVYPLKKWMYQEKLGNHGETRYYLYPRADFYLGLTSEGHTEESKILIEKLTKVCAVGVNSVDILNNWRNALLGKEIIDWIFYPNSALPIKPGSKFTDKKKQSTKNDHKKTVSQEEIKQWSKKYKLQEADRSRLTHKDRIKCVISSVYYKNDPKISNLTIDYQLTNTATGVTETRTISLFLFIAELGTRFQFENNQTATGSFKYVSSNSTEEPIINDSTSNSEITAEDFISLNDSENSSSSIKNDTESLKSEDVDSNNLVDVNDINETFILKYNSNLKGFAINQTIDLLYDLNNFCNEINSDISHKIDYYPIEFNERTIGNLLKSLNSTRLELVKKIVDDPDLIILKHALLVSNNVNEESLNQISDFTGDLISTNMNLKDSAIKKILKILDIENSDKLKSC